MHLVRRTPRFGELSELVTFEMRNMWRVSHRSIMTAAVVTIMLMAIVTVASVAWHGRGRWY
jgi:hypothetical protein